MTPGCCCTSGKAANNCRLRPERRQGRYNGTMITLPASIHVNAAARRPMPKAVPRRQPRLALVAEPLSNDTLAAAHRLYRATLELLSASDDPVRDQHRLAGPLSQVVARQSTRIGQSDCADLARAIAAGDHAAALDACRHLIELEAERAG